MLSTLLLSRGTPLILGGDEFGRTQQRNNNAYCQDSDISWFDWSFSEDAKGLLEFSRRLIELRQRYPLLSRSRFLTGQMNERFPWALTTRDPLDTAADQLIHEKMEAPTGRQHADPRKLNHEPVGLLQNRKLVFTESGLDWVNSSGAA
jgi:pullulanase/glycogen debranching enzyme